MIPQESSASNPDQNQQLQSEDMLKAIQELKLTLKPEIANLRLEHDHLRQRVNTLTGVLLGAGLLIITSSTWMAYRIQSLAQQSQSPDQALQTAEGLDRLRNLEQQLKTLSEKTPENLLSQVQDNQTQLKTIAAQLTQVEANAQNLQSLTEAVRELTGRQIAPAPEEQPSPAQPAPKQSTPAPSETDSSQ